MRAIGKEGNQDPYGSTSAACRTLLLRSVVGSAVAVIMSVPQLKFLGCDLESITLTWERDPTVDYKLEHREILVPDWVDCRSETVSKDSPGESVDTFELKIANLNPSSSYIFRLYIVAGDGQLLGPGPEVAFDTEVVSCAPKSKTCCTIA